jgi:hypothetical protein
MELQRSAAIRSFEYPRSYHIGGGWRAFLILFGIVFGLGGLAAVAMAIREGNPANPSAVPFLIALGLAISGMGFYALIDTLRSKIVLDRDAIERSDLRGRRLLRYADIAGVRITRAGNNPPTVVLIPKDARARKLKIPLMFKTDAAFDAWFEGIPNLDAIDAQAALAAVQSDPKFGATADERVARLGRSQKLSRYINGAATGILLWCAIYPRPYELVVVLAGLAPVLALILTGMRPDLFRLEVSRQAAKVMPSIAPLYIAPGLALFLRAIQDFQILDWKPAVAAGVAVALAASAAAVMTDRTLRTRPLSALLFLPLMLAYGYGVVVEANALLDHGTPKVTAVQIDDMHISSGKHTSYRLTLDPWGPYMGLNTVDVSRSLYDAVHPGDAVCPRLFQGALGIRWYVVTACRG